MTTRVHLIDVGQGNMTLLQLDNNEVFLYDCNVTNENKSRVLQYIANQIGWGHSIDVFVCSHRDTDHLRGIKTVHAQFPVQHVWDSGATGTSPGTPEYEDYMDLRRRVGYSEVEAKKFWDRGFTRLRVMNSKSASLPDDANAQSIVIKVVEMNGSRTSELSSVMLTGDSDAVAWKNVQRNYDRSSLDCAILVASHHGSNTYFDDPSDTHWYTDHLQAKSPAMTLISVGPNSYGHPESKALEFYARYSTGSDKGNRVYRTDARGTMKVELKGEGGWSLDINQ